MCFQGNFTNWMRKLYLPFKNNFCYSIAEGVCKLLLKLPQSLHPVQKIIITDNKGFVLEESQYVEQTHKTTVCTPTLPGQRIITGRILFYFICRRHCSLNLNKRTALERGKQYKSVISLLSHFLFLSALVLHSQTLTRTCTLMHAGGRNTQTVLVHRSTTEDSEQEFERENRIHFTDVILSDRSDRYCFMTEWVSPRY